MILEVCSLVLGSSTICSLDAVPGLYRPAREQGRTAWSYLRTQANKIIIIKMWYRNDVEMWSTLTIRDIEGAMLSSFGFLHEERSNVHLKPLTIYNFCCS